MSKYRKIDTRIWNDAKFRGLSNDGQLVFVLLLTHPAMTSLGALPSTPAGLAHMLKWSEERLRKGLAEPLSKGMVEIDEEAGLICLPNFLRYNQPENPNVVKAWVSSADLLPECELKDLTIARAYEALRQRPKSFAEAFAKQFGKPLLEGSANRSLNHMPNQEQEQEPEQEPEQDCSGLMNGEGYQPSLRAHEPEPNIMTMTMAEAEAHMREKQGKPVNAYAEAKGRAA